jgi:hypothetical protein
MNEPYFHLSSRQKRPDICLSTYICSHEEDFVKLETIRGAWQSRAVANREQFTAGVRNFLLPCLDMLDQDV